jgi:hypothetical protein
MIQTAIKVVKDSAGGAYPALLNLPDDYATGSNSYPLLVFLQGAGEAGTDLSKIYGSSTAGGPAYFIEQGKWPASFNVGGKPFKLIVVSPQSNNGWSTTAQELDFVLTDLIKNYRVDQSRIYLTGLSAGGEGILEYVGGVMGTGVKITKTHKIAAVIPMSAVLNASQTAALAQQIVTDNVEVWGFGSPSDTHGANTLQLITWYIGNIKKGFGRATSYTGGHSGWMAFYTPDYAENIGGQMLNIYQWALQYTSGSVPTTIIPPPPVAKTIKSVSTTIVYTDGGTDIKSWP